MRRPHPRRYFFAVLTLASLFVINTARADVSQNELLSLIKRLNTRLDNLEKHNAELEQRLARHQEFAPTMPALEERLRVIENHNARIAKGLENDNISENEPNLTARLKAVEMQSTSANKAARTIEALDGVTAGVNLTTTAQRPTGNQSSSQLNYRGDIFVTLPLGEIGNTNNKFFAQFRLGQGDGLNALTAYAKPNATAFRVLDAAPDNSVAVLGQAWWQADIPLPLGGFKPYSRETLEVNVGKMDPFIFFDQNAAANDEARQFLNTVFVHNPLLDAGGDIGVDANGFSPGLRMSYFDKRKKPQNWRLSLGIFGAGQGANYTRFFSSPLLIAQAETQLRLVDGLPDNYRFYYWRNGQAPDYAGRTEVHTGWGISVDQRWGDATTLFARYGNQIAGHVRFDQGLTFGAEIGGNYWNRSGDVIGVAAGRLRTSKDFARDSASIDANGDGLPDYGFAAGGAERIAELYYRYRINKQIELTPDYQIIATPGGNTAAPALRVAGLRLQLSY